MTIKLSNLPRLLVSLFAVIDTSWGVAVAQEEPEDRWHSVAIPDTWRNVPKGELKPIDGYSWYRCLVKVPADWKESKVTLYVEALDDARATYVNGMAVGATGTFPPRFRSGLGERGRFPIDQSLLKTGEFNCIAVRVFQNGPRPNFSVAPPVLLNESDKLAIRLNGQWQYRPGDDPAFAKATPIDFNIAEPAPTSEADIRKLGGYAQVDHVQDVERYVTHREGDDDPLTPQEAVESFEVPDDLQMQLVLSEPEITQPLFMTWDERGRMWVVQYRQYPEVAGVKMLSRDVYLRSVYDKAPEPPPHGAKGRDRITIHEDTNGDGVYDVHKTFVDGLNIASSVAIGRGGVFVTNPPYLLFYPDRNSDDIPDGDPEVLLEGFGLEDSHSVINSLRFGPDGWLYGAQGSTVTAKVKRPGSKAAPVQTMGQQIWRYHPEEKRFEVFAEGGGNTFGVEIDDKGRIYSGHNGGDTRGFHYVQGGYYRKGFGKHGALSNPFTFGYFAHIKHGSVPRFTHNFIIYEEHTLPETYHGKLFGIEPLQGQVVMSDIRPYQSSFETEDISRVIKTNDQWFRPVDIKTGPDGGIYVADMYEQRIDHSSHYAGRIDRTNGRIYRLTGKQQSRVEKPVAVVDHSNGQQLIQTLNDPAKWQRQTAQRLFGDRRDTSLAPQLLEQTIQSTGQTALGSLWALNVSDGLTDEAAIQLFAHEDQFVRAWTVRLKCDELQITAALAAALTDLAAGESYLEVRKQLACSAKRLPAEQALPILRRLFAYDEDAFDIHQPLLLWWAIEQHAMAQNGQLILRHVLNEEELWTKPLVAEHMLENLMKRYAIAGSRRELQAAAALLKASPNPTSAKILLQGFETAYKGRSLAGIPQELVDAIAGTGGGSVALRLRQGDKAAIKTAIEGVSDTNLAVTERQQFVEIFGEIPRPEFLPVLTKLISTTSNPAILDAALTSLQSYDDPEIAATVVNRFDELPEGSRLVAETLLASRSAWALRTLGAVESGDLQPSNVSQTGLRKMLQHDNQTIRQLIKKHWGDVAGASTSAMKAERERLTSVLAEGSGNPKKGKPLYMKNCGKCHRLFNEGGQIGPDLTSFKRDDQDRILTNVVNPSLEIREGFENHIVATIDGRVINGFLADRDPQVVVLRGVDGQNIVLKTDEIEDMFVSKTSIMPEGALKTLTNEQIRDLFAYLRSSQPVNY